MGIIITARMMYRTLSTRKLTVNPYSPTNKPPMAGHTSLEDVMVMAWSAKALGRSSLGTVLATRALRTGCSMEWATPDNAM